MSNRDRIVAVISDLGFDYEERAGTIHTTCPECEKSDKLSIRKRDGATICYRGSCGFKGTFLYWIVKTARISFDEARLKFMGEDKLKIDVLKKFDLESWNEDPEAVAKKIGNKSPTPWPVPDFVEIDSSAAIEGLSYLNNRGISVETAKKFDIRYSVTMRRVVFPITQDGICYGWQARAIDKVADEFKVRNNVGFIRAESLMFFDHIERGKGLVIVEGPFDALKFNKAGNFCCTMGMVVTDQQLEMINDELCPAAVFIGLDADAYLALRTLPKKLNAPCFQISPPQSAIDRCAAIGKKADFGECTEEECLEALRNAKPITGMMTFYMPQYVLKLSDAFKKSERE